MVACGASHFSSEGARRERSRAAGVWVPNGTRAAASPRAARPTPWGTSKIPRPSLFPAHPVAMEALRRVPLHQISRESLIRTFQNFPWSSEKK
jgi:hypothetical protein